MAFVEDLVNKPTRKLGQAFFRDPSDLVNLGDAANPVRTDPTGTTSQPITAVSLPLPTGASTLAAQTAGNTSLSSIDGKLNSLGQKTMAVSVPVVLASDQSSIPVAATQSGTWNINNISGTISLPTGAATQATLATLLLDATFTARINTQGQKTMALSTPVVLASDQTVIPVSQSGAWTVTANAGTNLNTSLLALEAGGNLATIAGKDFATQTTLALIKAKTDNLDVALSTRLKPADTLAAVTTVSTVTAVTAITNALPTGANTIGKVDQGTGGASAWKVDGSAVTQPVSGTVTANIGTAGGLALDATLTGGTQRTKITDGTNNVAVASATPVGTEQGLVTRPVVVFNSRADTYTIAANGTTVSVNNNPVKYFSVQVKGTGGVASNWDVRLEGSLDNVTFSQILRHRQTDGDGTTIFTGGTGQFPSLYFRSRLVSITLGPATNIVVTILGMD